MPSNISDELKKINELTTQFFNVFNNKNNRTPNIEALLGLFIPNGVIINNTNDTSFIYNLETFIKPRVDLLTNGTLKAFSEHEISHKTEIFNTIAHRFSHYEKSGILHGNFFKNKGVKTLQFIKTNGIWKLSSVAWCDEK